MKFKVNNINCEHCANTIKKALRDDFGDIQVDVTTKEVSLKLDEKDVENFKSEMDDLGFEVVERLD
ncbi:heavy-metal-associated domain-containing protein [Campylobacter geochelonis]|uniref:Heavy metal transport/detoxification protein n=1 Tax=Campylobacter geochelonis TaxID=1780362 RepID=A0A128EJK9_9BACT|nr:heavy-metal-associated domain-containing protein [Campylobacter geochelonis]QKF71161.1 heavy-metal-associated domain-containing protein, putative copper metallochaperone CopZ [Campylobacter geochelonis]CZE48538.1 heavy metal transport/detoxification protein [Campylobacter geochelonis]